MEYTFTPMTIYEYLELDKIKNRPGLYIAHPEISILYGFILGFLRANTRDKANTSWGDIMFGKFSEWVALHFDWPGSTAGWRNIILKECNGDESKSFDLFFILYEEFVNDSINNQF